MNRIRVDDSHKRWIKDSKYRREYKALEKKFSLVSALIEARTRAGLTQPQLARRMKTTQAVIARLAPRQYHANPMPFTPPQQPLSESTLSAPSKTCGLLRA